MEGRYRLVGVLRKLKVSDRHIRATLRTELGLSTEEADEALAHEDEDGETRAVEPTE